MRFSSGSLRLGFLLAFFSVALPALSHPLGNFSIDHYSRVRVTPHDLRVRYVIDMAEIPAFQELLDVDADGDRQVSTVERRTYLERIAKSLAARLTANLNGTSLTWRIESRNLIAPSSVAPSIAGSGAATLRVHLDLRAEFPTPLSSENIVRYDDGNYSGRTGWKEIIVEGDGEIRLLRSSVSRKDLSNELTRYPPNVSAPPQDVSAEFTFAPGAGVGWNRVVRAMFRDEHYLWLMAIVAALGLFVRWRGSRKAGA